MVKGNQVTTRECYLSALREATMRAPVINTAWTIEENKLEKPHLGMQISDDMKDGLQDLYARKRTS